MELIRPLLLFGGLALIFRAPVAGRPLSASHVDDFAGHPRAIVVSDIGNEPDDQMSLVRLLLYSNEIDIEALIASHQNSVRLTHRGPDSGGSL
jgi:hypothetical protein